MSNEDTILSYLRETVRRFPDRPAVSDAVRTLTYRELDEAVKLIVVPKDPERFNLAEFRHFLQQRLERHQVPSKIECVPAIPRTANGKTDQAGLCGDLCYNLRH